MAKHREGKLDGQAIEAAAREMLERQGRPDVRRLFTLIHDVNPTGRDLPPAVERERYALKSRLQSLLVKHFRDDLAVAVDAAQPGFVVIRHRHLGLEACHASLDSLDDHARSWVRFELDTAASEPGTPEGPVARATEPHPRDLTPVDALVQRGRDALEAYDYDSARASFEAAFELSGGAAAAAQPLLELLVDVLADNQNAASRLEALSPECLYVPEIRALMALANARLDHRTQATALLDGATGARVGDVLAALVESALRQGVMDEADKWLAALHERDPGHRDRDRLDRAVAAVRARERAPAEEALSHALAANDLQTAEARAKDVLARWPESELARRAMRTVRDGLRQREITALVAQAEHALATGAIEQASSAMEGLRRYEAAPAFLEAEWARAMAERTERENARRVSQAVESLTAKDLAPGLRLYLGLPPPLRARVRELSGRDVLDWVERIEASGMRTSERELVAAVVALDHARGLAGAGDAEGALAALLEHEAVLHHVAHARELATGCRQQIAAHRRTRAVADVAAVEEALAAGHEELARKHLGTIDRANLDAGAIARIDAVETEIARRTRVREGTARVSQLQARGDSLGERNEVSRLVEMTTGDTRAQWEARREVLDSALRREWHVCDVEGASEANELIDVPSNLERRYEPVCWLLPDGREMVFATVLGRWLFLRRYERSTGRVQQRRMMRLPDVLAFAELDVEANGLWVSFKDAVLRLAIDTWDVLGWWDLSKLADDDNKAESVTLAPGGRYAWLILTKGRSGVMGRVFDLERSRVCRQFREHYFTHTVRGSELVDVIGTDFHQRARLMMAHGAASVVPRGPEGGGLRAITPHPSQHGLLALVSREREEAGGPRILDVYVTAADGRWKLTPGVDMEIHETSVACLATSRGAGVAFATLREFGGGSVLVAFTPERDGFSLDDYVTESAPVLLAQDASTEHLVAIYPTETGIATKIMDGSALELPGIHAWHRPRLHAFHPPFFCDRGRGESYPDDITERTLTTPDVDRLDLAKEYCGKYKDDPAMLASMAQGFQAEVWIEAGRAIIDFAYARFPKEPVVALLRAGFAATEQRWEAVRETIVALGDEAVPELSRMHRDHLLGLSLLYQGDAHEALRVLSREKLEDGDPCGLRACTALARVATGEHVHLESDVPSLGAARILAAIQAADAAMARGEFADAIATLHRPPVLGSNEQQGLARLAAAHLAATPTSGAQWFQKALALAEFCEVMDLRTNGVVNLPVPHDHWDDKRLETLAREAASWLEDERYRTYTGGGAA